MNVNARLPLAVDLDGSLIATDLSEESAVRYLIKKPWMIIRLLILLISGRAKAKRYLSGKIKIDVAVLPYNRKVLEWLKEQRQAGRQLLLVSGSDQVYVDQVAEHLKIFSSAHGSDGKTNLIGENKSKFLVSRFGEQGFEYLGNSKVDLFVWKKSAGSLIVSGSDSLVESAPNVIRVFPVKNFSIPALIKSVRIHQWSKSLLVFLPAFTAHEIFKIPVLIDACLAFLAFGLISSSGYILNDISDLDADRNSVKKSRRPFAGGQARVSYGLLFAILLLSISCLIAFNLSLQFVLILGLYFLSVLVYSARLKSQIIIDLVLLSGFYCLRVLAGGLATDIQVSKWLLLLCVFLFFSLACIKRYIELLAGVKDSLSGRGYRNIDVAQIGTIGAASGFISALVIALWANSPEITASYISPQILWLLCPLMIYWIGRIWILAGRSEINHDPVVFALKDKLTYLVACLAVILIVIASNINLK